MLCKFYVNNYLHVLFIRCKRFNVLHIIVRSLSDKFDELIAFLANLNVDFSYIILTWLSDCDFLNQFSILTVQIIW